MESLNRDAKKLRILIVFIIIAAVPVVTLPSFWGLSSPQGVHGVSVSTCVLGGEVAFPEKKKKKSGLSCPRMVPDTSVLCSEPQPRQGLQLGFVHILLVHTSAQDT